MRPLCFLIRLYYAVFHRRQSLSMEFTTIEKLAFFSPLTSSKFYENNEIKYYLRKLVLKNIQN